MDSIKSPRFLLALAGLVAVSVLAALKIFSADMAYGLFAGLLYGVGVSTPASKQAVTSAVSLIGAAGLGIGAAVMMGGCCLPGAGPDAVLSSFFAALIVVAGIVFVLHRRRSASRREAAKRIRDRLSGRALLELRKAASRVATPACLALALLTSTGCASTDSGHLIDPAKAADAMRLSCASHQAASSVAMAVCEFLPAERRAKCLQYAMQASQLGAAAIGIAASQLGGTCPARE